MSSKLTRRDFIVRSSQVAAGIWAASYLTGCSKPGSQMRFGLVTYLWGKDWDLPTLLKNCEVANIPGVELRTQHAHSVEPTLTPEQRADIKKMFADSPVKLVGLGCNEDFDDPDPVVLAQNIEGAKAFIKLSHDVGGSGVKVKPNDFHENVPHEQTIDQIGKSLNEVGKFAADYNQQVRLEVHGKCSHLPTIKAIMDIATHPNVAVCWNSNEQDLEGEGLEYNFNLVKERFGDTVHVRELNIGDYPYQQLMDLLVKMDYNGWVLLEARTAPEDRIAALKEQLAVFNKMVAEGQVKL
jgi:sugar phosphate isomerase/epimerase